MTQLGKSATASPSLAEVALWIAECDQSTWLRKYELREICDLLLRHRNNVHVIADGDTILGAGIGAPNRDAETVHVVFITSYGAQVMARFREILKSRYPWAKYISYVRRGKLGKCPINRLRG